MKKRLLSTFMALLMVCSLISAFPESIGIDLIVFSDAGFYYPLEGSITRSSSVKTNGYYCDYVASSGTPVYAPCDGTVQFCQSYAVNYNKLASYGNNFIFTSSNGVYKVRGAHLSSFNGVSLKYTSSLTYPCSASTYSCSTITLATKSVSQGDLIGYTGMTGNASGPHLHLEVSKNGNYVDPVSVFETWTGKPIPYDFPGSEDTSYNVPVTVYATHDINEIYSNSNGSLESGRYISNGDKCYVDHVYKSGLCHVKYPSGGTEPNRWAYCKASELPLTRGCTCSESYAGTYEVTTSQYPLNIRNGHGSNCDKIGEMPKGAHCTVTKADGTWAHVEYDGVSGFASMEYLTKVSDPTPQGNEMSSGAGQTIPDGDYIIVSELGLSLYLDIPGVKSPADPATYLTICDGDGALPGKTGMFDTWTVKYLNNGFYKISQYNTNICLDVENASRNRGAAIQTCVDNGTAAQQWSISETSHGYTLQAKCNSWYLDVKSSETATGTPVIMWEGTGNNNQSWSFIPVSSENRPIADGEYYIKSATGNAWLDVSGDPKPKGNGYSNESNVQIWDSKTDSFNVKYISDGYYKIYETTSGLALDVYNPTGLTFGRGTNVQVYDGNNLANRAQLWRIKDEGNGNYRLISNLNGYSLDVNGGLSDKGTNVQIWTYNTSNAQKWSFEKVHKHTAIATAAKAATCTANGNTAYWYCSGCKKYFSDSACTKEITLASTVISATGHDFESWSTTKAASCTTDGEQTRKCCSCGKTENQLIPAIGHKYVETVVEPTCTEKGYINNICSNCGDTRTISVIPTKMHNYKAETIPPTETTAGYDIHTCIDCGEYYIDNVVPPISVVEIPTVSYVPGDSSVRLTWTAVKNAERYAVCGYVNNRWQKLADGNVTSYTLKNLKEGINYKVAVIAMVGGKWKQDYSNAITVTPAISKYPKVTSEVSSNQFRLKWTPVANAEKYGIAVYQNNKWKVQVQVNGNVTTFTSPKIKKGTYTIVVCAKVNGKWDTSSINSRAFKITLE